MILTIGHSTRTLEELLSLLEAHGVREVVDVRRYPASWRHPHFGSATLAAALALRGIGYRHDVDLGGRRRPRRDSPNTAWRSAGFRGYADHMETPGFQAALERLILTPCPPLCNAERGNDEGGSGPTGTVAILCAEAVPWRCHRQLIADALVARGIKVGHILGPDRVDPHRLSSHARVGTGSRLRYPADAAAHPDLFRRSVQAAEPRVDDVVVD